jgi:Putative prokaryotic signal transducing protein
MALVEIGRFNRNEAHILIGRLDSEGIPAIAFDGNSSIADGSYLFIPVRLMVDDEDAAAARRIIADAAA